jgi:type II secretory pathway component GspD/PulD (secretin)
MKKTKMFVVALLAGFALHQPALCQINATDASPTAAGAASTNLPAAPAASNDVYALMTSNVVKLSTDTGTPPKVAEGSNQPVSFTTSNESAGNVVAVTSGSNAPAAMAGSNEPVSSASISNAVAGTTVSNAPAAASPTNSTASVGTNAAPVELPIQLQDVPITTAIESLARLAGINYLLDPKIGYGQPDDKGQIKPEPTLSIRWENVTAQQALLALLDNYGLQLVENPKTKIFKITTKEPNALPPLIPRVIQLKFASTSNMMAAVMSTMRDSRSRVVPDARTSQLVVVATEKEQADVDTLISQLDKPTRQVLIETKLIELSSNPTTTKGIDWSGTLQAQNVSFGNGVLQPSASSSQTAIPGASTTTPGLPLPGGGSTPSTTTTPGFTTTTTLSSLVQNSLSPGGLSLNTASGLTPAVGFLSADGVKAVLSFLNQSSDAQVISTPRVVTLDNETATIQVVRAFPVFNTTAGTQGSPGGSELTYSNLGTILQVTPRISANDYVWLKVQPSVSSFFGTVTKTVGGFVNQADEFDTRAIDTQVLIPNANTLVMGGLVKDSPSASYTKVPILGDIPGLGWAFRSESKSLDKDNLIIFITPTILKDTDFHPATTDFLNSQPRSMSGQMNPNSRWDSAQPNGDWSDPLSGGVDKKQN